MRIGPATALICLLTAAPLQGQTRVPEDEAEAAVATVDPNDEYDEAVRRYRERIDEKIVGGVQAADHEFPWQVSLGVAWITDAGLAHYCGGSVYSAGWIVTAGHCVAGKTAEQIAVAYGSNTLDTKGRRANVERIVRHKDYRWHPKFIENDIALLKLRDPIVVGPTVRALPLLSDAEAAGLVNNVTGLVVTGWGRTRLDGTNVSDLRKVDVKFIDRPTCSGPLSYGERLKDGMVCAGVDPGGSDACKGDSGGPLIWRRPDGTVRQVGVVSFGDDCAVKLKWGVYASSAYYRDWVIQNAR